jgi:hypothetical protein
VFAVLARLLAFGPPVAALIAAEERAARWWPLRFPRSPADLERDPERLFNLLTTPARGLLAPVADRSHARLAGQTRAARLTNEPDKNRMTAGFDLTVDEPSGPRTIRVLTKFQSGRGMPLYMQAIRAVAERRFAREIEFYRRLAPVVPVAVPTPLFADAVTLLNRVCLVLDRLDGVSPADWRGCPLPAMRSLLAAAARLNASFVDRVSGSATSWIPARTGLEFAEFVTGFIDRCPPWYRRVWTALKTHFATRPVTLVHGDCRPGNMLFRGTDIEIAGANEDLVSPWPETTPDPCTVVMCDWEAVNVAPLLWDFTYCTIVGLRVADRRAWQPRLLSEFLDALGARGVDPRHLDAERAAADVQLLAIVLAYISLVVFDHRLWSGQGNTDDDVKAWSRRVLEAGAAGEATNVAATLGIEADDIRRLQEYFLERRTSAAPPRS